MNEFELLFRGALWRYLKRQGLDVARIYDCYNDRDENIVVCFTDSLGRESHYEFGSLSGMIEKL